MKLTNPILTCLLITIIISCSAQTKWDKYSDEKGKLQISFYGKPIIKTETEKLQFGTINWTIASIENSHDDNLRY
ncbi:MAG TPA: hypothetical protein VK772_16060 [Puia sp.]|nr:hypothetical protein [Puia sp.]